VKSSIPLGAICLLTTNVHGAREDRVEGKKKDETKKKSNSSSKRFMIYLRWESDYTVYICSQEMHIN